jgi:hypothetical protein
MCHRYVCTCCGEDVEKGVDHFHTINNSLLCDECYEFMLNG